MEEEEEEEEEAGRSSPPSGRKRRRKEKERKKEALWRPDEETLPLAPEKDKKIEKNIGLVLESITALS